MPPTTPRGCSLLLEIAPHLLRSACLPACLPASPALAVYTTHDARPTPHAATKRRTPHDAARRTTHDAARRTPPPCCDGLRGARRAGHLPRHVPRLLRGLRHLPLPGSWSRNHASAAFLVALDFGRTNPICSHDSRTCCPETLHISPKGIQIAAVMSAHNRPSPPRSYFDIRPS